MKGWKFHYKTLGHRLENSFRKYRAYLKPHCYKQYRSVPVQIEFGTSLVSVIDLGKTEIITDSGRYFHGLVKGLLDSGHSVYVVKKLWVVGELYKKRFSKVLLDSGDVQFIDSKMLTENAGQVDYLWYDVECKQNISGKCKSAVKLRISGRPLDDELWMPYQVHPDISLLPTQDKNTLDKTRGVGVFFIGNVEPSYESDFVKSHQVMSRIQVLEALLDTFPNIIKYGEFDGIDDGNKQFKNGVLVPQYDAKSKKSEGRIPSDKYIDLLSGMDFVICTPGTSMPFAHNVIEAMSQGCIPILEYAHYFSPQLEDGLNCLSFSDKKSLKLADLVIPSTYSKKVVARI